MYGSLFKVTAKRGKVKKLIKFLECDGNYARDHEPETFRFEFYRVPKDKNSLYVYEAYRDKQAFEKHKQNPPFKHFTSPEFKKKVLKKKGVLHLFEERNALYHGPTDRNEPQ